MVRLAFTTRYDEPCTMKAASIFCSAPSSLAVKRALVVVRRSGEYFGAEVALIGAGGAFVGAERASAAEVGAETLLRRRLRDRGSPGVQLPKPPTPAGNCSGWLRRRDDDDPTAPKRLAATRLAGTTSPYPRGRSHAAKPIRRRKSSSSVEDAGARRAG